MSRHRRSALLLALGAVLLTTACGQSTVASSAGATPSPTGSPSASPSVDPAASELPCTPSGTGTTNLLSKPTIKISKAAPPVETTNIDIVCGTGKAAKKGDSVKVKYVGVLYTDGTEFDSSWSRGADVTYPFDIGGRVVAGFSLGVTGMREGGRREVIIPAKDGYGDSGSGPIPAGATLIFVIDLVKLG